MFFFLMYMPLRPSLPPPAKKKEKNGYSMSEQDRSKITQLGGQIGSKVLDIFLVFCLQVVVCCWDQQSDSAVQNYPIPPPPQLPKTPCEDPTFLCLVLLVMSSVSQTIWHLLAQGANGLRWSMEFRYYVLGLRCVKSQNLFSYSRNICFQNSEQKGFKMT